MKSVLFVCLLLAAGTGHSQRTITGNITDESTGKPLPGSSIFLSNTSVGTVSDSEGNFQLANLPYGRFDLIISSVGYETQATTFTTEQLPLQLKVALKVKVRTLDNVTVEPSEVGGWERWGLLFTESFLGQSGNAKRCKIRNHKDIQFRYFKKSRRLVAYCDEPIIIENKALGYEVRYQLEDFEIDMMEGTSSYAGYPYFEDLDKKFRHRWTESRDRTYYGSVMHFMRSLYTDSLLENGFETYRMVRKPNLEKQRVSQVYHPYNDTMTYAKDSIDYYQKVMRQRDNIDILYKNVLTADSLIIKEEGEFKHLFFTDFLYVIYRREMADKLYLEKMQNIFSPYIDTRSRIEPQASYLYLVSGSPILVDSRGNFYPPQDMFTIAYWAWSDKVGDMLPLDYIPYSRQ